MKSKWLGKTGKITGYTLAGVVLAVIFLGGMLHTSPVQGFIARKASAFASRFMECEVKVGKLDINLLKRTVTLRDVEVFDCRNNRTVFVREGMATLKSYDFSTPAISSAVLYGPQIRINRYKGDTISDFKRVIMKISALPKKDTALRKAFVIERARIVDGMFTYDDWNVKPLPSDHIDYKHVGLDGISAEAAGFYSRCGKVMVKVKHVECNERTGFRVDDFSSFLYVDNGELKFTAAHLKTPQSKVDLDLRLKGESWLHFNDFIDNVHMDADVFPSEVAISDLGHFVPVLRGMPQKVGVDGRLKGTVGDMDLKGLHLNTGEGTSLDADFTLRGLPRIEDGYLDLRLRDLRVESADLRGMVLPNGKSLELPGMLKNLRQAQASGSFSGDRRQFFTDLDIRTNLGDVKIENAARDTANVGEFMAGHVRASGVRLGELFQDSLFGTVSLDAEFRLRGYEASTLNCHFQGNVSDLEIDRKVVKLIPFHIDWQRDSLRADVACADPDLDFTLEGIRKKVGDTAWLRCESDVRNIDLKPLRLLGDTGSFTVKSHIRIDNKALRGKTMQGILMLDGTEIHRLGQDYRLACLRSEMNWNEAVSERSFKLRFGQLEADMTGRWDLRDLKYSLLKTMRACIPHFGAGLAESVDFGEKGTYAQDFDLRVRLNDADSLMAVMYPSVSLPLGLKVNMRYASGLDRLRLKVDVPYVQWGSLAYMDGGLDMWAHNGMVELETGAERLYLDDSVSMNHFLVRVEKEDTNTVAYGLSWGRDSVSRQNTHGNFEGLLHFLPEGGMRLELQDFGLQTGEFSWRSYPDGYVLIKPRFLSMHHVGMFTLGDSNGISLEGVVSHDPNSTLKMRFTHFDLSYLEFFLRKIPMKIDTWVDGTAELRDLYGDFLFDARLRMKDLAINGHPYGQGSLKASYYKGEAVHAAFEVVREKEGSRTGKTILSMDGKYYPAMRHKMDFTGYASELPVGFLDKIVSAMAEDLSGLADGKIRLGGTLRSPELSVDAVCKDFAATISMMNTRYSFAELPVRLTSSQIVFPSSRFVDQEFNTAGRFSGKILHRNFQDIRLDLNIDFNNLLALNKTRGIDLPFWGTVFATGMLDVEGPAEDILLRLNAQVADNSDLSFDVSNPAGGSGANFITFKVPQEPVRDSGRLSLEKYYARNRAAAHRKGKITLDFNLEITPGLLVSVRLRNASMDGLLTATGRGALRMYMADDNPQLFGTYVINGGGFDFSMMNLLNKRFSLKEGGTVSWSGNVSEPRLDVRAGYQTKASLYPVLASFDPQNNGRYKQKVNVESIIALSGNMLNPTITFDIDLLNVDDDTKDKFWALVRKNNEDEMLRQSFSLLMFNSFMAVESGSSSSVGSSALASSSELLFSQFNNFLSRLSKDFNVGINYKPGSTTSNSEFQFMMSGQLFDDRLVINGNLGVADNVAGAGGSATTVVGDVDVEWKFTEELRLRGFNHSNDEDLTKPVNSYTQGVGIVFRRDFDNRHEFLHGTMPHRTRAERRAERKKNREIRQKKRAGIAE